MYFCISSTSFYLIFLIFRKYVLSTWFNKMLGPEFLLTCSGLHNSCCKWFCSRFGRIVTENVTTRDVGCRWTSPTPPNVWYLVVTFSDFIGNICRRTWVGYRASSIPAERFDIRLAGWHMFRHANYVVERASWRSCPTHLSDQEPAPSQLKYLMSTQLVGTCLHIIFMKQQDHPGGLVPPICQIQS